jgi:hypothetical protein
MCGCAQQTAAALMLLLLLVVGKRLQAVATK